MLLPDTLRAASPLVVLLLPRNISWGESNCDGRYEIWDKCRFYFVHTLGLKSCHYEIDLLVLVPKLSLATAGIIRPACNMRILPRCIRGVPGVPWYQESSGNYEIAKKATTQLTSRIPSVLEPNDIVTGTPCS